MIPNMIVHFHDFNLVYLRVSCIYEDKDIVTFGAIIPS